MANGILRFSKSIELAGKMSGMRVGFPSVSLISQEMRNYHDEGGKKAIATKIMPFTTLKPAGEPSQGQETRKEAARQAEDGRQEQLQS